MPDNKFDWKDKVQCHIKHGFIEGKKFNVVLFPNDGDYVIVFDSAKNPVLIFDHTSGN